ncbi:Alpha-galactosidase 3 [Talaromyces islandicus]|uniref:alpha-galactosidase n=1 Tax=Talaromyces islandicus TaxID=28573 RepID=A0A0U1M9P9_TALIS|nr:Alpha-galactosidase 3 [Talaromyces islandicus]
MALSETLEVLAMHPPHATLSVFIIALFAYIVGSTFYSWYRLRHIKGPWLASVSKSWLIWRTLAGTFDQDFHDVCEKYGRLARIGPYHLLTSDPDVMRRMLGVRSRYRRSEWYTGMRFDPSSDNVESQKDEAKHNALRSKMAAGYSGREVDRLEERIDETVQSLVRLFERYISEGSQYKPLDFGRKAQYFTLDVISAVAHGKPFGYLDADTDLYDYIKLTEKAIPAFMVITILPWLMSLFQWGIFKALLPSDKDPIGFGKIMGITKEVVNARFRQDPKHGRDMLDSFIRHGLTQHEAVSEGILQIIAGSDTTATAIRVILLYLITTPRVLEKFRAEYTAAGVSSPIRDSEARALPYLQAIIKEGLRIWPPVVGLMAKEVPPEGDTIDGKFIPGGTNIGYCAFGIFRSKQLWGEDANIFRPERWLDSPSEQLKEMEQNLELVFAYGRYKCLGRDVAQMELNKVFIEAYYFEIFNIPVVSVSTIYAIQTRFAPTTTAAAAQAQGNSLYVPYYGTSANGFTAPPRGWNSFGLQALEGGFTPTQDSIWTQCQNLNVSAGYNLCSIDSGWSGNGGDSYGRLVPDTSAFPNLTALADELHSNGMQLGVYILPGAFASDGNATVEGTDIQLGSLFDSSQPSYNLRQTFDFSKDGVQQWHDSVVNNFAAMGIDYIKLDYMTPGSPGSGEDLPANNSLVAIAYHNAIQKSGAQIRLDLSWGLDRNSATNWYIWRGSADGLRLDQDINNSGQSTLVSFGTVQRAIENYRVYINQQVEDSTRQGIPIMIRPDMDNMYTGNGQDLGGLADVERYTVTIHWVGAGANLITGSNLSQIDTLGQELLYDSELMSVANFTTQYPMQPKNPLGADSPGAQAAQQLQAWIAGPDSNNANAVVVLANYGPDQGNGGFGSILDGTQLVNVTLSLLGIADGQPNGAAGWNVRRVLGGGGAGGPDHSDIGVATSFLASNLGPGESVLYYLTATS